MNPTGAGRYSEGLVPIFFFFFFFFFLFQRVIIPKSISKGHYSGDFNAVGSSKIHNNDLSG